MTVVDLPVTAPAPRLRSGTVVLADDERVTFLGLHGSKHVAGDDALALLLPVARLLDGSLSPAEIGVRTGLPAGTVTDLCGFLEAQGLLEPKEDTAVGARSPLHAYLTAHLGERDDATTTHRVRLLSTARVLVVASAGVAGRIVADLSSCGMAHVRTAAPPGGDHESGGIQNGPGAGDLVILERGLVAHERAHRWIEQIRARGAQVLTFSADAGAVEVGPSFGVQPGVCLDCYLRSAADRWGPSSRTSPSPADLDVLCGLLGQEVMALLGGVGDAAGLDAVVRSVPPGAATVRYLLLRHPDCETCPRERVAGVEAFENLVQLRRPAPAEPLSSRRRRAASLTALPHSRPPFPYQPRTPLPAVTARPDADHRGMHPESLARLLAMTAGRRFRGNDGPDTSRWAPSGGNLASVELYAVFTGSPFTHPPATVLRYDDLTHELVEVSTRAAPTVLAGGGPAGEAGSGQSRAEQAHVVLTANLGRLSAKYGNFALRLAHLDAGCALAQLSRVAQLCGLVPQVRLDHFQQIADELELLDGAEIVTAHVVLTPAGPDGDPRCH